MSPVISDVIGLESCEVELDARCCACNDLMDGLSPVRTNADNHGVNVRTGKVHQATSEALRFLIET